MIGDANCHSFKVNVDRKDDPGLENEEMVPFGVDLLYLKLLNVLGRARGGVSLFQVFELTGCCFPPGGERGSG